MRRRFRLFLWFFRDFFKKYSRLVIISLIIGVFLFGFTSRFSHFLPQLKKTKRIGIVGRYTTGSLPFWILEKISYGLTKKNPDGSPAPGLAQSWEIKEEGKIYLIQLQSGLIWQDKTPLKAKDILYDLENIEITSQDDYFLEFKLQEPFSPFLTLLNRPVFKKGLLGIGEYQVQAIEFSGDFIRSLKLEGKETLIFKFYPTETAAILGFKLGEIDELKNISNTAVFENWPNIEIKSEIIDNQFVALFYNTKNPRFEDKTLRQALTYALPKPEDESRALGPVNPHSWAYNSQVKPYDYNPVRAQELLKEAEVKDLQIELITTFSQLSYAEKIKEAWQKINIETHIKIASTVPDDFQVLLASQEIPADPDQYTIWHSTQTGNLTDYNNPKVDKLLEDGRKTLDMAERKAIYLDFQRFLLEDVPAAFLFHPTVYTISRKS